MSRLVVMNHPLVQEWMSVMRDKRTDTPMFREATNRISELLTLEVVKSFPQKAIVVETPVAVTECEVLNVASLCLVPVLRAGLGMVEGCLRWLPFASVRHVGLARDEETLQSSVYLTKLSAKLNGAHVLVLDPMLATGGTGVETIRMVKEHGAASIQFMAIIASPEGIKRVRETYPDVDLYIACVDDKLNDKGYIVPGLGDAGDRLFGTL